MKRKKKERTPDYKDYTPRSRWIWCSLWVMLAVLVFVSLMDYHPTQSPWLTTRARQLPASQENLVGMTGVAVSFFSLRWLGLGSWLIPVYSLAIGYCLFLRRKEPLRVLSFLSIPVGILAFSGLVSLLQGTWLAKSMQPRVPNDVYTAGYGGVWGTLLFEGISRRFIGILGSFVIFLSGSLLPVLSLFYKEATALMRWLRSGLMHGRSLASSLGWIMRRLKELWAEKADSLKKAKAKKPVNEVKQTTFFEENISENPISEPERDSIREKKSLVSLPRKNDTDAWSPQSKSAQEAEPTDSGPITQGKGEDEIRVIESERVEKIGFAYQGSSAYVPPDPGLLMEAQEVSPLSAQDHAEVAQRLQQTLEEFGVKVTLGEVHAGPVITRYEVLPAAGVRVEKISNLDKNIAMALKAIAVRILAPVPGKGCVGIEIPNAKPATVCIRDILESKAWGSNHDLAIPLALGKEVSGKPLVSDLSKMPHLLIAGSTGSGKTVCINSIITSLLFHAGPEDLRFIMVDPKIVEMQVYNKLPHMLIPVVTEPKKVPGALKWLLSEMQRRYQLFAKIGVRNIAGFNAKQAKEREAQKKQQELEASLSPEERVALNSVEVPRDPDVLVPKKLPYIVCIIDELADLMMVAASEIETSIARLAQLARAAGIHMIIATQRPSVNVITGVIKANLPCRIAFKVASKVDSRTILDCMGADQLIGRGDLLFLPPGTANLLRAQGALVLDEEINRIVDAIHDKNGPPQYVQEVQDQIDQSDENEDDDSAPTGGDMDEDPLLAQALEIIQTSQRASTSMLQRRLSIGYNRAARIMEILEQKGFVGPENGSKPREILKEVV